MPKMIFTSFFLFFLFSSYSQRVERWKINDSTVGEIVTNSNGHKIIKEKASDSIQFFFIGIFFQDTVKVVLGMDTLVNTILSTKNESKQLETDWFRYLPKVKMNYNYEKYIYYLINNEKIQFPFKRGYLMAYFSNSPERTKNGKQQQVYSLSYRNEYLGRL